MYRAALRSASRPAVANVRNQVTRAVPRRPISTASPADKRRSWKSSAVRWGLAIGAVYYYTTSNVFAEETKTQPTFATPPSSFAEPETTSLPTVESVIEEKRKQAEAEAAAAQKKKDSETKQKPTADQTVAEGEGAAPAAMPGSPGALEEEAGQQGAFNPETGEINWDCPCLGGMADGPCGEEFKTAFSCFVYSTEEPKGMDCIDKFQGMQECFRKYPEIYGAELEGDETDENGAPVMGDEHPDPSGPAASVDEPVTPPTESKKVAEPETQPKAESAPAPAAAAAPAKAETKPEPTGPKWEDATAANTEVDTEEKTKEQPKKE
ncbi:hypothetical protein Golomagni_05889 [Golovinomyces magnicellulatus]|nr:hypothetical protein Golomagni_05889 [Golovinomyces magnicellulatus]